MRRRPIRHARFAFVDVETTGVSSTSAVVEVAVQLVEGGRVLASFESLVDPLVSIPPFVTTIHGIDDAMVCGHPPLAQLAPWLVRLCEGAAIVAHNAAFDRRFLPFLAAQPSVCSYRLAARIVPEAPNHRNQTLRAFFDVPDIALEGRSAHRALADVIVTRNVFFHCVDRYVRAGHADTLESLIAFTEARQERRRTA